MMRLLETGLLFGICAFCATSCGGGSSGPTAPPPPRPVATIQVSVTAANATFTTMSGNVVQFELATSVTFRETAGVGGTIQRVTGTIVMTPSGQTAGSGALDVAVSFAPNGTATGSYTQPFEVALTSSDTAAVWRFTASGIDSNGRAFNASSVEAAITFPAVQPPPRATGPELIRVFGGPNYDVYLGCFNCNEFHPDSIWNRFGTYGSPFSPTSINNQFSQYGSPFSTYSACNEFASQPPVVVDSRTFYGELTLNAFRPRGIRDATIVSALRGLCAN